MRASYACSPLCTSLQEWFQASWNLLTWQTYPVRYPEICNSDKMKHHFVAVANLRLVYDRDIRHPEICLQKQENKWELISTQWELINTQRELISTQWELISMWWESSH